MSVTNNSLVLDRAIKIARAENPELFEGLQEDLIKSYAYRIGQRVLNETNRSDLPQALTYTIADMIADFISLTVKEDNNEGSEGDQERVIKSIKEGDVTVTYSDEESKPSNWRPGNRYLQTVMFNYSKQIQQFRKMAW